MALLLLVRCSRQQSQQPVAKNTGGPESDSDTSLPSGGAPPSGFCARGMQRKGEAGVLCTAGGTTDPAKMRLQIYPRRKAGQKKRESGTGTAVVVSLEVLNGFADIPLVHAAKKLGISKTALKSACRTLGLERWPFRRPTDCLPVRETSPQSDIVGKKRKKRGTSERAGPAGGKRQKLANQKRGSGKSSREAENDQELEAGRQVRLGVRGEGNSEEDGEEDDDEEEEDGECQEDGEGDECSAHASVHDEGAMPDLDDGDEEVFAHRHEGGMDKGKQCDEVWASDTEERSSDGAHGSSDKTSCGDSRSSSAECCARDIAGEREFNDLSWMSHAGGNDDFGPQHTLDDAPLLPLVIKAQPPAAHTGAKESPEPPPSPERMTSAGARSGEGEDPDDDYYLHARGDYMPGLPACYSLRSRHDHDYFSSTHRQLSDMPGAHDVSHDAYHSLVADFNSRLSSHRAWAATRAAHGSEHGRCALPDLSNVDDNFDQWRGCAIERERTIREMALNAAQARYGAWARPSPHAHLRGRLHSRTVYVSCSSES